MQSVFSGGCDSSLVCVAGQSEVLSSYATDECPSYNGDVAWVTFPLVAGSEYWILVQTPYRTSGDNFALRLSCFQPPPNDMCDGAIDISCDNSVAGSTLGAISDSVPDCGSGAGGFTAPGVWYKVRARPRPCIPRFRDCR